jgi:hypothetical protein
MPELAPQSTPPSVQPPPVSEASPDNPPPAIPPIVDPSRFEEFPTFRETFLAFIADPDANAIFRGFGELLFDFILEYWEHWPDQPEGELRANLRAAVADMRHVQGYLAQLAGPHSAFDSAHEEHLAGVGGAVSREIGALADRIERELGTWRGEEA